LPGLDRAVLALGEVELNGQRLAVMPLGGVRIAPQLAEQLGQVIVTDSVWSMRIASLYASSASRCRPSIELICPTR
jgi:hypothetical protein